MKRILLFWTCILVFSVTAYGQFPTYPFNRIDLGTQTDNNKYLIWVDNAAPVYTPVADTNAYVAIDTLSGVWYYYRVDSAKWLSLASGASGSTELADGVTILGDGSTGNEFRADTALIATQSYVNANDDTGTDSQTLTFTDPNLSISGGNTQDISGVNYWTKLSSNYLQYNNWVGINKAPTKPFNVFGAIEPQALFESNNRASFWLQIDDATKVTNGDQFLFSLRGDQNDFVASIYDASLTTFRQMMYYNIASNYMRLSRDADLAIGNVNPAEKLHVAGGSIRMADGSEAAGSVVISDANGTMSHTTTPESSAAFSGWDTDVSDDTLSFSDPNLAFAGSGAVDISGVNYWDISGSNVYRSSGNVGIGTTNPLRSLHVQSDVQFQPQGFFLSTRNDQFGPFLTLAKHRAGGSVSVNDALGTLMFQGEDTGGILRNAAQIRSLVTSVGSTSVTGKIDFITGGTVALTMRNGNTGINELNPTEKLHVSGGSIRMADGSEAAGSVVISDANGTMSHTTSPESSAAFSGWDTDNSDDFSGAWSALTGVPSGFADNVDDEGVTNVTVGTGLDVTGASTKDIDLDFGELETVTTVNGNDEFVMRTRFNAAGSSVATNAQVNVQDLLINTLTGGTDISVSASGTSQVEIEYTGSGGGGTGDITAVIAGDHLTGGGTSGSVTLNVDEGDVWEALVFENEFSGASNQSSAFVGNDYRILRWSVRGSSSYTIDIPDPDFAPNGAVIEVMIDNTSGVTFDCGTGLEIYEFGSGSLIETDDVTLSLGLYRFVLMPDPNSSSNIWAIQK